MAERRARLPGALVLRLYIAGGAPNSVIAVSQLEALRKQVGPWELEIVDVLRSPRRALEDRIVVTPTLVKVAPPPEVRIVGNLRDAPAVLRGLGLAGDA